MKTTTGTKGSNKKTTSSAATMESIALGIGQDALAEALKRQSETLMNDLLIAGAFNGEGFDHDGLLTRIDEALKNLGAK